MSTTAADPSLRLIWIDLEMTGLDPDHDSILEIATLVTDGDLNELAVGPVLAIRTPLERLQAMDDWNRTHHSRSGLWQRALEQGVTAEDAQAQTLAFLKDWVAERASPMCGNSICQDRRFLYRHMPALEKFFHYRNLDVSSVKELARRWAPQVLGGLVKTGRHQALDDVRESVIELQYYRRFMGVLGGAGAITSS